MPGLTIREFTISTKVINTDRPENPKINQNLEMGVPQKRIRTLISKGKSQKYEY